MIMMTCIIVDDEQHAIDVLEHYIRQIPSLQLQASFTNPLQALDLLNERSVDIIFLDIALEGRQKGHEPIDGIFAEVALEQPGNLGRRWRHR